MKMKDFESYLLRKGFSSKTVRSYVYEVTNFKSWALSENLPIEKTTYNDVLGYIQSLGKQIKQRTVASKMNSIKHYFNFLMDSGAVVENPTTQVKIKGIKKRTLYHILNRAELESLYHNFKLPEASDADKKQNWWTIRELTHQRNKVILGLIIYQGLSTTELARLTEKDVQLREGKIKVQATRKSNARSLKLEAHQVLDVMEYTLKVRGQLLEISGKESDKLLVSSGLSQHFNNSIAKLLIKLKKQNSKVHSMQQIRSSVITTWLKTYNLREVQYMAGHRYVSSTESYLLNDLEDLQEDISKFHPIG